ncbi:hypothetical protein BO94DRAFT_551987 [Aspergillus sclerotioniger CBS 115572]|uniref:Uncharacterized protein n=1 Tax=Aspergillus sclerotioniger CBS 115572 TaxID=1450535 RepID=A0A317XES4_9EURO|nr:hypothetical protein BO94DRAFT_551987 [Aspergillus sclerotioniger CBS 115572]PWY96312.1 hypothetical protein BO94DRAFT_551987 [Aspergillus sclerotioniger CBS 115572]
MTAGRNGLEVFNEEGPTTPALRVSIYAPRYFWTENPDKHFFTLTISKRLPDREEPKESQQPCILSCLYHGGFQKLEVENTQPLNQPETPRFWSLSASGSSSWKIKMGPALYQPLKPGELHELFWPGGEDLLSKSTPVILPRGACCSFTLLEGMPPPRRRGDPIIEPCMTVNSPGVLILSLEIDAPSTWKVKEYLQVTYKVTYHGVSGDDKARPITFGPSGFEGVHAFGVHWHRHGTDKWESWHGMEEDKFITLQPYETWTWGADLTCLYDLPEDARVDWGTKENHMDTVLTVPGLWGGAVLDPPDNEGRPKVVVPASVQLNSP